MHRTTCTIYIFIEPKMMMKRLIGKEWKCSGEKQNWLNGFDKILFVLLFSSVRCIRHLFISTVICNYSRAYRNEPVMSPTKSILKLNI